MQPTQAQASAAIMLLKAIAETIREVGEAPSGAIYAALMTNGISLDTYTKCVDVLKKTKLVSESHNLLKWEGPK